MSGLSAVAFGVLMLLGALCGALGGMAVGVYQFVFHEPTVSASTLRTFTVQGAPQVVVTNPAGSVTFAPGEDGAVRVEATSRARDRTEDDARKALGTITLDLRQDGEIDQRRRALQRARERMARRVAPGRSADHCSRPNQRHSQSVRR